VLHKGEREKFAGVESGAGEVEEAGKFCADGGGGCPVVEGAESGEVCAVASFYEGGGCGGYGFD